MSYTSMVELIRNYEPFSDCSIGQFEACDHLGSDFESKAFLMDVPDMVLETKTKVFRVYFD